MKGFVLTLALAFALEATATDTRSTSLRLSGAGEKKAVRAEAALSGIEDHASYRQLPPVLVELSKLPRGAAVWVELKRGSADSARAGVTVESKFFSRQGGEGILSVPGIHKACRGEGPWTVSVLMSDAKGTSILCRKTFSMQSEIVVASAF